MNIIEVNKENVSEKGFFCYMSKKNSEGYKRKLKWLNERFDEGLKIKMLDLEQGGRGFIEYVPGEFAWRAVNARGYMFIHCIWVAGKSKDKGYATLLLDECAKDARNLGMKGIAVLTSEGNWLVGKRFFMKHDFNSVNKYPPFELMAKKFDAFPSPTFSGDYEKRIKEYGKSLTIFRSDQCPYVDAAVKASLCITEKIGIKANVIELKTSEDVRRLAPSPYGVFSIVYNGKLISYHYLAEKELIKNLTSSQ